MQIRDRETPLGRRRANRHGNSCAKCQGGRDLRTDLVELDTLRMVGGYLPRPLSCPARVRRRVRSRLLFAKQLHPLEGRRWILPIVCARFCERFRGKAASPTLFGNQGTPTRDSGLGVNSGHRTDSPRAKLTTTDSHHREVPFTANRTSRFSLTQRTSNHSLPDSTTHPHQKERQVAKNALEPAPQTAILYP